MLAALRAPGAPPTRAAPGVGAQRNRQARTAPMERARDLARCSVACAVGGRLQIAAGARTRGPRLRLRRAWAPGRGALAGTVVCTINGNGSILEEDVRHCLNMTNIAGNPVDRVVIHMAKGIGCSHTDDSVKNPVAICTDQFGNN